jgi:hypothetical protein
LKSSLPSLKPGDDRAQASEFLQIIEKPDCAPSRL